MVRLSLYSYFCVNDQIDLFHVSLSVHLQLNYMSYTHIVFRLHSMEVPANNYQKPREDILERISFLIRLLTERE